MTELDKQWNLQFKKVLDFKRKYGHCIVPIKYEQDKTFGKWVNNQRTMHTNNKMRQDRKELLDEIGFVWRVDNDLAVRRRADKTASDDKRWHQQYKNLVEFNRKNRHCIVPIRYDQDKAFGRWVTNQRQLHHNNKMRQDRKELLDEIGFVWRVNNHLDVRRGANRTAAPVSSDDKKWHLQYKKLVAFKQKNGNCIVPVSYEQDKPFGCWASRQRTFHSKQKMRGDRKELLDELGFVWKVDDLAACSSTTDDDVRGLVIGSFHPLVRSFIFLTVVLLCLTCVQESDLEAFTSSVGLPDEAREETEPAQGSVRNQFLKCPCFANRKRPRTCLAKRRQIAVRTNERDKGTVSCNTMKKHGGHDDEEEDASPFLITTSSVLPIGSNPSDQQVLVQEDATPDKVPSGWSGTKLEPPAPANRKRRRTRLAESREMASVTNHRDNATGSSCNAVKKDDGHDEDSSPSLITTNMQLIGYDPSDQEIVQEDATPDAIPAGWTPTKLEPDW